MQRPNFPMAINKASSYLFFMEHYRHFNLKWWHPVKWTGQASEMSHTSVNQKTSSMIRMKENISSNTHKPGERVLNYTQFTSVLYHHFWPICQWFCPEESEDNADACISPRPDSSHIICPIIHRLKWSSRGRILVPQTLSWVSLSPASSWQSSSPDAYSNHCGSN